MAVNWSKDVDQALIEAEQQERPILPDFGAAPAGGACAWLDAESYEDPKTAEFMHQNFLPVKVEALRSPWVSVRATCRLPDQPRSAAPDRCGPVSRL